MADPGGKSKTDVKFNLSGTGVSSTSASNVASQSTSALTMQNAADKKTDEDGYQPSVWKVRSSNFGIPLISVNELAVELDELEPRKSGVTISASQSSRTSRTSTTVNFTDTKDGDGSSSEERLKSIHTKLFREQHTDENDSTGIHQHLKQWRRKLLILIWLNFTMRYRRLFNTFIEVVVPIFILWVLVTGFINNGKIPPPPGQSEADKKILTEEDAFSPFNIMPREVLLQTFCANSVICNSAMKPEDRHYVLIYAPKSEFTTNLIKRALEVLKIKGSEKHSKLIGVKTAREVDRLCKEHLFKDEHASFPTGIVFSFNDLDEDPLAFPKNTKIPPRLNYVIRTFFEEIVNTVEKFPLVERLATFRTRNHVSPYIITGVAGLQTAIDQAYIEVIVEDLKSKGIGTLRGTSTSIDSLLEEFEKKVHVQQFAYPFFLDEDTRKLSWSVLMIVFIMTYIPSNFCFVQDFCYQAQQGRTELLKFHGLTPILHFLSHGIITCIFRVLTSVGLTIVLYYTFMKGSHLPYPSTFEVWLFLFSHAIAEQTSNLFIAHFFSNPSVGGMMVIFRSVVTFLGPMQFFVANDEDSYQLVRVHNIFMALGFTQWNFANGLYSFLEYQLYDEGLKWYDFAVMINDKLYVIIPLQTCCMIFVYAGTFYMCMSVYLDVVFARTFSPGKGFFFCFKRKKPEYAKPPPPVEYEHHRGYFENIPSHTPCTIKIRNLCKVADDNAKQLVLAVDDFSLDIHEGEITAIVGKAGAGKSRLLGIICGLEVPTSGSVEIKNLNVTEHGDVLSQYLSLVPQHDMLFDTLSVEDHVKLSCMLHGISYRKSKIQTKSLMQLLELTSVKRNLHTYLSVTQQKRLSIAMALASHPNILILDEPMQGLDIDATKQLWRTLQLLKSRRTIIISTSSMEGISLFCDRMALMAQGKLIAYASPSRIKRTLDAGFVLNLREDNQKLNIDEVEKIIRAEVKDVVKLNPVGYEPLRNTHRYLMPYNAALAALLEKLEDNIDKLRYSKCWVGSVDLDSLFYKMSIRRGTESVVAAKETNITREISRGSIGLVVDTTPEIQKVETNPSQWRSFKTLLYRKIRHTLQKNKLAVTDFLVPLMLFSSVIALSEIYVKVQPESSARPLRIKMYQNTHTFIRPVSNTQADQDMWYNVITKTLDSSAQRIPITVSMKDMFKRKKEHSLTNFKKQSIVAFEKSADQFIGFYSSNAVHSGPIALNIIANSYLRMLAGDKYHIQMTNYPLRDDNTKSVGSVYNNATTIFACLISLIVGLISAAELNLPMTEIKNSVKRLITMSGVKPRTYWAANWMGDTVVNAVITAFLVALARLLDFVGIFKETVAIGLFAVILLLYLCWASIPFSCIFSHIIETKTNGYTHFLVIHFGLGILLKVYVYQNIHFSTCERKDWDKILLRYIGHLFPPYSFTSALVHFFHTASARNFCCQKSSSAYKHAQYTCDKYNDILRDPSKRDSLVSAQFESIIDTDLYFRSCCRSYCDKRGICHEKDPFFSKGYCSPGLREDLLALAIQGVLYWILLIAIERRVVQDLMFWLYSKVFGNKEKKAAQDDVRDLDEPEEVKKEHTKVDYMIEIEDNVDSDVFLVQNVTKFFNIDKCIDHAYFTTPVNESTAILGLSKSGLTTLVKILTTELTPSAGYIYMDNELMQQANKLQCTTKIGYCPQVDAYFPQLTAAQNLYVMGRLRGVETHDIDTHVHHYMELFDLLEYVSVPAKTFRPGIKRKLACAMAMVGQPKVLIMDQPTLRMDSSEQHTFWKCIKIAKQLGETVIYTSSDTEEVLASANKVILLDDGSIISIGNTQDVVQTSARGYILTIRFKCQTLRILDAYEIRVLIDQLRDHIVKYLSPCELLLDDEYILIYSLMDPTAKISYNYGIMEGAREKFPTLIDQFLVTEPSLDEIVLNFHKSNQRRASARLSTAPGEDHR